MITKEFLEQSLKLTDLIESSYKELENLREMAKSVQGINYGENVKNGGNYRSEARFVSVVEKISELEDIINKDICTMIDNLKIMNEEINLIENSNEKLVLKLRYVSNFTWQEIADKMGYSVMQTHRIHKKALSNFK